MKNKTMTRFGTYLLLVGLILVLPTQRANAMDYYCSVGPSGGYSQNLNMVRGLSPSDITNWVYVEAETYGKVFVPFLSNIVSIITSQSTVSHGASQQTTWITSHASTRVGQWGYMGLGSIMNVLDGTTRFDRDCGNFNWIYH